MKKTAKIFMMLFLAFALVLTACSKSNNDAGTGNNNEKNANDNNQGKPQQNVTLRIVTTFGGGDPAAQVFSDLLKEFEAANPGVKIEDESMSSGDQFRTKVFGDFSTNNEPDVTFFFTGADAKDIIEAGKVLPMDPFLEEDPEWASKLNPAVLDLMREADGNLYAIPVTGFFEGMFVNKKIFEDHGLDLPTDWDKLNKAIETLSANGIIPIAAGMEQSYYLIEHYILSAAGSESHNDPLTRIDDGWILGLEKIKEHYEMKAFPADTLTIPNPEVARAYYDQGQAAMLLEGSWAAGALQDYPDVLENTVVLPFPVIPGGNGKEGAVIGGFSIGFYLSKSSHEDPSKNGMALKLIKHLTTPEAIERIASANGGTPAAIGTNPEVSEVVKSGFQMVDNAPTVNMPIDSRITPAAFTHIRTSLPAFVEGKMTAREVLEGAKQLHDNPPSE